MGLASCQRPGIPQGFALPRSRKWPKGDSSRSDELRPPVAPVTAEIGTDLEIEVEWIDLKEEGFPQLVLGEIETKTKRVAAVLGEIETKTKRVAAATLTSMLSPPSTKWTTAPREDSRR